jgi:hypothetical protein
MEMRSLLSTIARQIETAKNHAGIEERRGDDNRSIGAILRSLRVTYVALSTGLDPWRDANHLFLLTVSPIGEYELTQAGSPVPVNAPFLAYLFWTAGVELAPGQLLLLEPELAKAAIEEALGAIALEQAFAERERQVRRAAIEEALSLPRQEEVDSLQGVETRANLLWDRKIELVAASLVADEYLERSRALSGPEEAA